MNGLEAPLGEHSLSEKLPVLSLGCPIFTFRLLSWNSSWCIINWYNCVHTSMFAPQRQRPVHMKHVILIYSNHTSFFVLCFVAQSCPIVSDPRDFSPLGSSVHGDSSRQEYWSGLPCPPPGDLPNSGIEPRSLALQVDSLPSEPPGNPTCCFTHIIIKDIY